MYLYELLYIFPIIKFQDVADDNIELGSNSCQAPTSQLSAVPRSLQDSTKLHSIHIMVKKEGGVMAGLLKLLAMYYVFHLTYLKTHGMVLVFCKLFDG